MGGQGTSISSVLQTVRAAWSLLSEIVMLLYTMGTTEASKARYSSAEYRIP